ncbi:PEP-CTERM sorting domain-containing protein [Azohydromonas australica]|uniref:PEP-CTERM sorting domain-containing protein n=1 Tax=Azohydromonas australica TaxID=364039 RepID=UPI00040C08C5|nr:PEP-CTERM sorting domain-containing protein [Azohydromonas australica]
MKKLGLLMLGAALSAGTQAATISYDFTSDQADTDFNFDGRLGLFDSTLGTLTSVLLEVYGEFTSEMSIGNAGKGTMRNTRVKTSYTMYFNSSLQPLNDLLVEAQAEEPWVSWGIDSGNLRVGPYSSVSFGPITEGSMGLIDASSLLSAFSVAGGGEFGLNCITETSTFVEMGGNGWFKQSTTGACAAAITYNYDEALLDAGELGGAAGGAGGEPIPVPEPPSLAVLGLGLGYMALRRGRSRKPAAA